ncbi:MAG TPA: archaetidylserine decarboxylase [Arenimonas sp.]|uniref:archaetidylserine decarboxylase n=1 Tax=Arenimonas sp. TaxID=1872635 RepID=UPI002C775E4C|nr:archaetidylserine decarboxylase [Arenimonas sp.]HMB57377.1 archaetidylserine decarboxylase [Arenimonas sp.]
MSPAVFFQYVLPHRLLSRLALWTARCEVGFFKNWLIALVIRKFNVDMSEAADPEPRNYASFNAFFTRALKPGVRTPDADPQALLMPADGKISQIGRIEAGRIFQAKGQAFTAAELLGDDAAAAPFADGWFANIYLSPRDYHRVHMPWAGTLTETLHVPGRLFTVAPWGVRAIPRLFARNERLVCHFDTDHGPMAMVMVGALLVSGVETVWNGVNIPKYASRPLRRDFRGQNIRLERFAEMARFNYGSTVIVLLPKTGITLDTLASETPTRLGEHMGVVS